MKFFSDFWNAYNVESVYYNWTLMSVCRSVGRLGSRSIIMKKKFNNWHSNLQNYFACCNAKRIQTMRLKIGRAIQPLLYLSFFLSIFNHPSIYEILSIFMFPSLSIYLIIELVNKFSCIVLFSNIPSPSN